MTFFFRLNQAVRIDEPVNFFLGLNSRLLGALLLVCLWGYPAAGYSQDSDAWPHGYMAAVANPLATEAAAEMLARGGHAVDAAIAAHAVLGLLEPESSGLGGGGFMLVFQRADRETRFFDGREAAPAGARADMFMNGDQPKGYFEATQNGNAVGVPGAVALYKHVHDEYGKLPWADLFEPAIRLAADGFAVPSKLAGYLPGMARMTTLDENEGTADYFYPDGEPLIAGEIIRNPDYAETLRQIATQGPTVFYTGAIAEEIVAAARAGEDGGTLTMADMASYSVIERPALCGAWREMSVCTATPPSSGAMQIMVVNLYDRLLPDDANRNQRIRAFVDAQRLAYADRDHYFGDPDFVDVPVAQLLNSRYLDYRANNPVSPGAMPAHGNPAEVLGEETGAVFSDDSTFEPAGTSHLSIVDADGNAVSATMTVESAFGSKRWAAGFVLNNEMTDFARRYNPDEPEPANMVRPGARPRSSMSPTIVLNSAGDLFMVTGSPGGNSIPAYTAKTLLAIVDWQYSAADAVQFPNIIARGQAVRVETGVEPGPAIAVGLREYGYEVQESQGENSGIHVIVARDDTLEGAADPRRLGTVESGTADEQ
ncbi:MAG: gamma-glutamyltransferase [Pseudohongiellaceae bacterium]